MRAAWGRVDAVVLLALYALGAVLYLWLAATAPPTLFGEEASVSMRDVVFTVENRVQASVFSTNVWAPVYYWAVSHVVPEFTLFTGRYAKAVAMALVPPLVYLTCRRRLGCVPATAGIAGLSILLLPGFFTFAWVATENGLEVVPGLLAVLLVTSRRWWPWAAPMAAVCVGTHTAGLAWAAAVVVGVAVAVNREPARWWQALLGLGGGLAIVFAPLVWWVSGPGVVVVGGGRVDATAGDFALLLHLLLDSGESYYYVSILPAMGSVVFFVATALAAVVVVWKRFAAWPWLLVAVATLGLWVIGGNLPGTRRVIAVSVVAAILVGVATDVVLAFTTSRDLGGLGVLATGAAVVTTLVVGAFTWATHRHDLPPDWPAPPGRPMTLAFERLDADVRAGRVDPVELADSTGDSRAMAIVWLLAERAGRTAGLPPAREIVALPSTPAQVRR